MPEKERYWKDPDRHRKHAAKHYDKKRDRRRRQMADYYRRNRTALRARARARYRERRTECLDASRARRAGAATPLEQAFQELCDVSGRICFACRRPEAEVGTLHLDHVVPLARGGAHDPDNIQPLCLKCNSAKGTKTIDYRTRFLEPPPDRATGTDDEPLPF